MYPRANQFPQLISLLPRNVVHRDQWCPRTRVGKASNRPSVLPSIARQNCGWDTLLAMHLYQKPSNNRLGSRSQTSALKKDRDLDHAHTMGRDRTRVGGSTDAWLSYVQQNRRHASVDRSKWVWWRTWVLIIICLTKQTRTVNRSIWVWWRTWVLCRPCMWAPDIVIIFLCVASITSNIYRNNAT